MNGRKAKIARKRMKKEYGKDWAGSAVLKNVFRLIKRTYARGVWE